MVVLKNNPSLHTTDNAESISADTPDTRQVNELIEQIEQAGDTRS